MAGSIKKAMIGNLGTGPAIRTIRIGPTPEVWKDRQNRRELRNDLPDAAAHSSAAPRRP